MCARIAVLVPIHNAEKFLRECLDSILNQTVSDFELFACNDGSTDGSDGILREYAAKDPRIRIMNNPCNMGIVATRNKLLSAVPENADFIAWIDADDVMFPDRLQRQREYLETHPEIGGVGSPLEIIDENSKVIGFRRYPAAPDEIRRLMPRRNVIAQSSLMLRRNVIRETGGYSAEYPVCEDYDYWLRTLQKYELANLPEPCLQYRMSSGQSKQSKLKETIRCTLSVQMKYLFRGNFRFSSIPYLAAECLLLLLPPKAILLLFEKLTYHAGNVDA